MKMTLIAIGSRGDVQPMLALARGLHHYGHDVTLATHEPFREFVQAQGVNFTPLAADPQQIMREQGDYWQASGANPVQMFSRMRDIMKPMVYEMSESCYNATQGAEALVYSTLGFLPGPSIAEKLNIPHMGAYPQPVAPSRYMPSMFAPPLPSWMPFKQTYNRLTYALIFQGVDWLFRSMANAMRRDLLDLPNFTRSYRVAIHDPIPNVYGYSPRVVSPPPDWGDHLYASGYWFLDEDEWQPPQDLVDFIEAGEAPIYVGFGSMAQGDTSATTDLIVSAIQKSGERAILLGGWSGIGNADLPDTIFRIDSAPHRWLFPRMKAVVHHCGAGTSSAGMRAGVPTIPIPHFTDQPFWARTMYNLGVSTRPIPRKKLTPDNLASAIQQATSDEGLQARARALGEKIRAEDGVANAVDFITRTMTQRAQHPTPALYG
jgi:sterol 3beta-glucosyltransferase